MDRPTFHVIITTYNRHQMLHQLLTQLGAQATVQGVQLDVWIYDDGSRPRVSHGDQLRIPVGATGYLDATVRRRSVNGGKRWWWGIIDDALKVAAMQHWDYLLCIQDDTQLKARFFERALGAWNAIADPRKAALSVLTDQQRAGSQQWTGHTPQRLRFDQFDYWWTQWVDMNFLATRRFVNVIDSIWPIESNRWEEDPDLSSGVGRQISLRLHAAGLTMYHTDPTLLTHGDHPSRMHPGHRANNQLIA